MGKSKNSKIYHGNSTNHNKIMPSAPDSNLEEIQSKAEAIIQEHEGEKPNAKNHCTVFCS